MMKPVVPICRFAAEREGVVVVVVVLTYDGIQARERPTPRASIRQVRFGDQKAKSKNNLHRKHFKLRKLKAYRSAYDKGRKPYRVYFGYIYIFANWSTNKQRRLCSSSKVHAGHDFTKKSRVTLGPSSSFTFTS